jgi:hypothetical protein
MTLTAEQQQVIESLNDWHNSKTNAINLQASAGSGKTYTLCEYAKQHDPLTVTFLGPTHASLVQLRQRMPEAGFMFMTVAAALNMFPVFSNTSFETNFASFGAKYFDGLVIVDESSMLSEYEVKTLVSNCKKVIFSGDYNQLAPVKKKSAKDLLMTLPQLTLTTMMRAESQSLIDAGLTALKYTQHIPNSSEDGAVICHKSYDSFVDSFWSEVKNHKPGDCVWITRTNAEVQWINSRAHNIITGRTWLEPGDTIRLYATSKLGLNNTLAIVKSVEPKPGLGTLIISTEPSDGTGYKVEVALPDAYALVKQRIAAIVELFQADQGNDAYALELKSLRSIVEIDFPYAITTHKLHGRKAFFVAYSRAAQQLHVVAKKGKTKGVEVIGTTWVHKSGAKLNSADILNAANVAKEIKTQFPELPIPSASHLQCVTNKYHASKSAKGWTLA